MTFLFYIGIFIFFGVCLILSFIIMMQESKSMGLGASFGSEMSSSMFGTSTASVLKKATAIFAIIFIALALTLSYVGESLSKAPMKVQETIQK